MGENDTLRLSRALVVAVCPYCDREESFRNGAVARAWMAGHIQAEHADELPAFENDDHTVSK